MSDVSTPGSPALRFQAVGMDFGGLRALDAVSLDVPGGGITALIGPNGAGKTTLLNCVSGLCRHRGDIRLHGSSIARVPAHRRPALGLARTYQTPALLDDLSAIDNVMLGGHPVAVGWVAGRRGGRVRERRLREQAGCLLDRLGAARIAARPAGDLPHGDRRRVEVARALISQPRVLLLDEPAAGLGDDEARTLVDVAANACETVVLVEHDVGLVMSTARQVVVLASGRLLAVGPPERVSHDPRVIEAYLGDGLPA